ncbi:MAG: hypothetical protein GX491_08430 [Chloroflexi bacterium]|nr:hypothetical protein [Chloroflexota bacterium]
MRVKIAAGLLALAALGSTALLPDRAALRVAADNEVLVALDRVRCVEDALPETADLIGYAAPEGPLREETGRQREFYLLRNALAPRLVVELPAEVLAEDLPPVPWLIASYTGRQAGLDDLNGADWTVVKDCENGMFLLHRPEDR